MIDNIAQGLKNIDSLTLEQLEPLIASSFQSFDVAQQSGDTNTMAEYLSAARTFTERQNTLLAADGGSSGSEGDPPTQAPQAATAEATTASTEPEADTTAVPAKTAAAAPPQDPAVTEAVEAAATDISDGADTTEPAESTTASADITEITEPAEATTAAADTTEPSGTGDTAGADAEAGTTTTEETTVTASATSAEETITVPEDNAPIPAGRDATPVTITAGADIKGVSSGSPFKNLTQVGEAYISRIRSIRNASGGDGERHTVATITASYPEDRTLTDDAQANEKKIKAVLNPKSEAMVASGGYCAPLPVRYEIYGLGVAARPVRDSLPMFDAGRGGVRFVAPPVLGDLAGAVGLWTAANDANPGEASGTPSTKARLKVTCQDPIEAEADAVTLQLEFGNFMTRAFPELVNRNNELALVEHARFAELNLLSQMTALSTAVTASATLGIGRDFLASVARAGSAYRNRHRMPRNTPLRVMAPEWVLDAMRVDFGRGLPGDTNVAYADAQINQFLNAQKIRPTWHLDGVFGNQAPASALVDYPGEFVFHIFSEGTFLFLDGGTLDLGVVRDSELVGTNDYLNFSETFEGIAKIGVESLAVTQTSEISGAVVGTVAP